MEDFVYAWQDRTDDLDEDEHSDPPSTHLANIDGKSKGSSVTREGNVSEDDEDHVEDAAGGIDGDGSRLEARLPTFPRVSISIIFRLSSITRKMGTNI